LYSKSQNEGLGKFLCDFFLFFITKNLVSLSFVMQVQSDICQWCQQREKREKSAIENFIPLKNPAESEIASVMFAFQGYNYIFLWQCFFPLLYEHFCIQREIKTKNNLFVFRIGTIISKTF